MKPLRILLDKNSFTLLELIIVLAIFAILASAAVTKFVNIHGKTLDVQENTTMANLRTAILLYWAKTGEWWYNPSDDGVIGTPFGLLESFPTQPNGNYGTMDGSKWYVSRSGTSYTMMCPHFAGHWGQPGPMPGQVWVYCNATCTIQTEYGNMFSTKTLPAGTIIKTFDAGH
ncbi:MAG: type II secretion system protein [Candidatus Omnitrophota bacterium]